MHLALRDGGGQVFILRENLYLLDLVHQKECYLLSGAARSSSSPFVSALSLSLYIERCVCVCVK